MKKTKWKATSKQTPSLEHKKFRKHAERLRKILLLGKFKKSGLGISPQGMFKKNVKKQLDEIKKRQVGFDYKQLTAVVTR